MDSRFKEEWDGIHDRRSKTDNVTYEEFDRKLLAGRMLIIEHIDSKHDSLTTLIKSAFPNADLESHRREHEEAIAKKEKNSKIISAVIEKTVSGIAWSVVAMVSLALWEYFKTKIGVPK
jgi:hypothetical protein